MKILHTADWHLGKRSRRIDRAADLRRAVERVFGYCEQEAVDVLLIAGDLFDQGSWSEDVCAAVEHLKDVARPFLRAGGTILVLTGNHDKEVFCTTLRHALELADPTSARHGERWATGRFHLATRPTFCRLPDRDGREVQFVLMPYPTPSRYLDDAEARYESAEQKRRLLRDAFAAMLERIRTLGAYDPTLQTVLAAHLYLAGARLPNGYEVTEQDGLVCPVEDLGPNWAYVALGDVHRAQAIGGREHVRYSGSIERFDADERDDAKGVVLVEVGLEGLRGMPAVLPLEATPFLDVAIRVPAADLPRLEAEYRDAGREALVRCQVTYTAGQDDLDAILRRIRALFPRCYDCPVAEAGSLAASRPGGSGDLVPHRGFRETVLDYLKVQLEGATDAEAVLAAAESLIEEVQP